MYFLVNAAYPPWLQYLYAICHSFLYSLSFQVAYPPLLQYLFAPTFFNCWLAKKALNSLLVSMGNDLKFQTLIFCQKP